MKISLKYLLIIPLLGALCTLEAQDMVTQAPVEADSTAEVGILSPSAQISLLTCSPGTEIYELFGHSGIRVLDNQKNIDVVFNYGLFDFNQDDFIYRFVRGKTDYEVGMSNTDSFLIEYVMRGSGVYESVLNITQEEKERIFLYLMENVKPENKVYRYNFIFNNCATKIRDVINQNIADTILCPDVAGQLTFRDAVKLYTKTSPWSQFGFDLCLGRGMDREATAYEKVFLPEILGNTISQAVVKRDGNQEPLVTKVNELNVKTIENPAPLISPFLLGIILSTLILLLSSFCLIKGIKLRWLDAVLFGINALFGCLILFLILFSKHPFTYANFNIIWMNPIMATPILFTFWKKFREKFELIFYMCVCVVLVLFLLCGSYTEQAFNVAIYPFIAIYLIRSLTYVMRWGYKLRLKKDTELS